MAPTAQEEARARREHLNAQGYERFLASYTFEHFLADGRIGAVEAFRRLRNGDQLPSGAQLPAEP